ncbi:Rho guanyl-nucleotide exchange factor [Desmophyllum pertusum]|uniref:Rho guanyl-nucleotide exchange factor n=1 Tax=Desmophyllum pertusum TaxID=174260 RepID=A0A9W9ZZ01_9CNID|nr:Rho guanyl-nucleotide exchange factor [Desmophyllum pertusum]
MASVNGNASPFRPKLHNAKKFLSLQLSQTSHAISAEFNHMLRSQTVARKRRKVINEIFATERTYQDHLHAITSQFLAPLHVACVLPQNVLNTIFSNVEAIQAVNRELLSHMETLGLGDAFLAMAPFIKLYSTYANNFAKAQAALQEWEKKSVEFATFKKAQEMRDECKGLNLAALLITPVQRVPRYKLLLESLLNKTPKEHADFEKLQEATVEINKVAHHINENIRQRENFQKMLSIQNSLTGEGAPKILAPGRLFIKEGPLLKVCSRGSQERMFFLFSDILLYAKKGGSMDKDQSSYLCRRVLPLIDCVLEQVLGGSTDTEDNSGAGALFKITCKEKSLLLYSKSKTEALAWFKCIRDAISDLKSCRASLRNPTGEECELLKRSTPLTRSVAKKAARLGLSIIRQDSTVDCSSPAVCIKDSLYPLRKELQLLNKPTPVQSTKNKAQKMLKTGAATPSSTLATGSRSKETVINSPWIKSDVANEKNSDEDCSETQSKESDGDATSGQSCVRTRAQKRKLSFKENREVELFSPHEATKKRCLRPKLEVPSCVQAVGSPLKNAYDQVKRTPAKLRTTKYVIEDEDLVQSTTCAVM